MTTGYIICVIAAVGLLIAHSVMVKTKEVWLMMLYVCVSVVNLGYLLMSLTTTVAFAVFGNDVAYFGSVFLSMCMFLTIVRLCGFEIKKAHVITCVTLGAVMFAIIASSPMLPLYYKSVDIEIIDGATKLVKEYGVLHPVYMVYLLGYFAAMIGTIIHSVRKKKIGNPKLAGFIAAIVCSNIVIWLFEKMVSWEYEFLSVTYIISELLLLLVYWMMQDYVLKRDVPTYTPAKKEELAVQITTMTVEAKLAKVLTFVKEDNPLSIREREILEMIIAGTKRKEIADTMHLSENTIKTYTRTLYGKLGISCREELYELLLQNDS
jgi:DNA-binding CsgD family transcriptional regulator